MTLTEELTGIGYFDYFFFNKEVNKISVYCKSVGPLVTNPTLGLRMQAEVLVFHQFDQKAIIIY